MSHVDRSYSLCLVDRRTPWCIIFRVRVYSNVLHYFSFLTLLTMNIDRFLAIKHPLFHKTSVTKTKLVFLLLLFLSVAMVKRVLSFMDIFGVVCYATKAVFIGFLLPVIFFINYQMFIKAKTEQRSMELRWQKRYLPY